MIGIDIVQISRVRLETSFIKYILTSDEEEELSFRSTDSSKKEYIAGRFAVKEAIFKATQDQTYLNYCCLNGENGKPYIKNHPEIDVSIAHDGGIATAIVLIVR